ncbi:G-type lectin S-receptor-like serine/threonine-protein kinase RKS1 [Cinnamomum micranthum f. kanehirae]|uniref:G-type lectin S-receptor-like serine/threonine-protein kinase RKS1 n=1 Tax=Cinnamomum micranthum f. kanehirae TaxID=337451 RepID=A0A443PBP3_9MAGN|nr:G-type lectin S-receptor-like serine/threonine-protein kinase RKS1 [Cinnamomum micranthum f. kanehirae]
MACHQNFQYLLIAALIFFPLCSSKDTITPIQSVRDGETLVSAGKNFALGFFSPVNSKNRYIGIWFNNIPNKTVVWVANRENPVRDSSGILTINAGNLELVGDGGYNSNTTPILWSTNVSNLVPKLSNATLMDSGNLILRDDHHNILWQSFDHPTNTLLPNMKLGLDRRTGLNRFLTSWRSIEDPAPGEFSFGLDPHGMPQFSVRKGSDPIWRQTWNGQRLISMRVNNPMISGYTYVSNDVEIYFKFTINDISIMEMAILNVLGVLQRLRWTSKKPQWDVIWAAPQDRCDRYANCGAYGSCDSNRVAECSCLKGFEPKMPRDWNSRDWSDGCMRRRTLDCAGQGDGFFKFERLKLPDTSRSRVEPTWSLNKCKEECLKNCSCTAYASANVSGEGDGCVLWYGNLTDVKVYSDQGQDLYTRVAASELAALIFIPSCTSKDTITPIQSIRDGETLVSAGENFVLGFFGPPNSKYRYIGIWFNEIPNQTVVWVANRENPVSDSSGILTINAGNLVLVGEVGYNTTSTTTTLWSTNISTVSNYSSARLMDSGNLVLTDDHERVLWQSFDYPTNTYLPRMKMGLDRRTGLNRVLTSWKSTDDPANGEFSFGLDPRGVPNSNDNSTMSRAVLDDSGVFQRLVWSNENRRWNVIWVDVRDRCDRYGNCGAYGSCNADHLAECSCLRGFEPKTPTDWNSRNWSDGCVRLRPLDCSGKGDGFFKVASVKVPDTSRARLEPSLNLKGCEEECLKNCSCTAYTSASIREGGSGCVIWYGELIDIKVYADEGQDLYIRLPASELGK